MTGGPHTPGGGDETEDLGTPVSELRDVAWPVDARFPVRVRNRIERRVLTGSLLELFWTAPLTMLLEFVRWPMERITAGRRQERP